MEEKWFVKIEKNEVCVNIEVAKRWNCKPGDKTPFTQLLIMDEKKSGIIETILGKLGM